MKIEPGLSRTQAGSITRALRISISRAAQERHHRHARDAERHLREDHALAPSATAESISTPRFIGPGCITIASASRRELVGVSP
jgi:hypothetical protein